MPSPTPSSTPCCPHCSLPMQALRLSGHYGQQVEVDVCARCHLVWFDTLESVRLSGLGWLQMLRAMAAAHHVEHRRLDGPMGCVRCGGALKTVHNRTAFGRSTARECTKGHGQFQSFNLLLAERGLVRSLLPADLAAARRGGAQPCCVNCGGDLRSARASECGWCGSPVALLDVARLVRALAPGLQLAREDRPPEAQEAVRRLAWPCLSCGAPVDPTRDDACRGCGQAVLAPALDDVLPLLDELEPQLDALRGALQPAQAPALPSGLLRQRLDALERSRTRVPWRDPPSPPRAGDDDDGGLDGSDQGWLRYLQVLAGIGLLVWWAWHR